MKKLRKNPFELSLHGEEQPLVVLDELRNGLIAHLQMKACEPCVPAYGALSPRVHALEEDRIALMSRLQSLYEEINAYSGKVRELIREEKAILCGPCWEHLTRLTDVVNFVQDCDLQSPLQPFTTLLAEEGDEDTQVLASAK